LLIRSIFLSTIENPEPRYVLECFPIILAVAAGGLASVKDQTRPLIRGWLISNSPAKTDD